MKSDGQATSFGHLEFQFSRLAELTFTTFFTVLVFGFYIAHYLGSTGFFTNSFTPLLASMFFASVLFTIVTSFSKAVTRRKDVIALIEFLGATLFLLTAVWVYNVFPFDFTHVADVVPLQWQVFFSWINNDIGRIIVGLALIGGIIAFAVDAVRLTWHVFVRQVHSVLELPREA